MGFIKSHLCFLLHWPGSIAHKKIDQLRCSALTFYSNPASYGWFALPLQKWCGAPNGGIISCL